MDHEAGGAGAGAAPAPRRRRPSLALDLSLLGAVGVLLVAALVAGGITVQREFYSATAFVERYVGLLADGRAADALALPGVAITSAQLTAAGMPDTASDALLRGAALGSLSDVHGVDEQVVGDITRVTVAYTAGGHPATSTFDVQQTGWIGVAPAWRFARSPLALIELSVSGSLEFSVNGFSVDKRQIWPGGSASDATAPLPLLVFSPGMYSIAVDTAISRSAGVAVLSDAPLRTVPVQVQAQATPEFVDVIQREVEEFLTACARQTVLQPTGCPFGYPVQDRIVAPPTWSIAQQPTVEVQPDGAGWRIPTTEAVAHIGVKIRSLFDGSVRDVSEDVPFAMSGTVDMLPDGTASISITGVDLR